MKRTLLSVTLAAALGLGTGTAHAASFTYHGSLQDAGKPADGSYDIELTLYPAPSGGGVIGGPLVMYKVPVHNGSFSTQADFGPLTKPPSQAYVSVRVRSAGQGDFVALNSRAQVDTADTTSVCPGAWTLQGNAGNPTGSYLGTADTKPLTFEVNAIQVGQITPGGDVTYSASPNVVFGASSNNVSSGNAGATVSGGGSALALCGASATSSCINSAQAPFATVSGGAGNSATSEYDTVVGGESNTASGGSSIVGGGAFNTASGPASIVGSGLENIASGAHAVIPGGYHNAAGGDASFAGGTFATVRDATQAGNNGTCTVGINCGDYGTFVWNGTTDVASSFTSSGPNQFLINAIGGVAINGTPISANDELTIYGTGTGDSGNADVHLFALGATQGFLIQARGGSGTDTAAFHIYQEVTGDLVNLVFDIGSLGNIGLLGGSTTTNPLTVGTDTSNGNGAHLTAGGVWTNGSSRSFKEDFTQIDVGSVLAKVIELPVQTWFYKNDHQEGRHLGPVAEDFAQAFGLGDDKKYIATVDEEGVAFAAIQGLNKKLEKENAELRTKLDEVVSRLSKLENKEGE